MKKQTGPVFPILFGAAILLILALAVRQSVEQAEWISHWNTELRSSYSRAVGSMERIYQSETLTVSDIADLKAAIDFFWGQTELFADSPSSVTGRFDFDVVAACLAFRGISADLLEAAGDGQTDLAALKEKIDAVYAHIKETDDVTAAAGYIRENW